MAIATRRDDHRTPVSEYLAAALTRFVNIEPI